jgi:hypothetical protein
MAKDTEASEEVNAITKEAAKRMHQATEAYFDLLKKAISSLPSGSTRLGERLKSHAEQNVTATQDYMTKLSEAKTIQDAIRIQTEFMQPQFVAFGEQAKDLMEAFQSSGKVD